MSPPVGVSPYSLTTPSRIGPGGSMVWEGDTTGAELWYYPWGEWSIVVWVKCDRGSGCMLIRESVSGHRVSLFADLFNLWPTRNAEEAA